MNPLVLALVAALGLLVYEKSKTGRVARTGKSGTTWYVETIPGLDPGSVGINVYDAPTGGNLVLSYNQVTETGQRAVTYTAPSTSGQKASADFI